MLLDKKEMYVRIYVLTYHRDPGNCQHDNQLSVFYHETCLFDTIPDWYQA